MRILKIVTSNSQSIVITTGVMQLYNTGKLHTNMFLFLNFSKALFKQLCFSSEIFKTTKKNYSRAEKLLTTGPYHHPHCYTLLVVGLSP